MWLWRQYFKINHKLKVSFPTKKYHQFFFLFCMKTYSVVTHKKPFAELLQMNTRFWGEIRKAMNICIIPNCWIFNI